MSQFELSPAPDREPIAVDESGRERREFTLHFRWLPWLARLRAAVNSIDIDNLPEYNDNAAAVAGGLVRGKKYRTATGQIMVCLG